MLVRVCDIRSETVSECIKELEGNKKLMEYIASKNLPAGDYLDMVATHLIYENTDYITKSSEKE